MENIATERQIVEEIEINEMKTETATRIKENHASTDNATNVEKEDTGQLIAVRRKVNRNTMTSTSSLWETHSVENPKNTTMEKITRNGWETAVRHHT